MSRLAVVAVGGNALIPDPSRPGIPDQFEAVRRSMGGVVDMIAEGWQVVITHGNGPQVGFALRRSEMAAPEVPTLPMDYADADTQGVIGYMFQRALGNEFRHRGIDRDVVTIVTQVCVDADDPAMQNPSKPIGSFLTDEQARAAREDGWAVADDAGRGWRRVVPSPQPREIIELGAIRRLVRDGTVVVACGGGGVPVVRDESGDLCGIRAVIDKDLTAGLLACEIGAELLLISTAVDRVALDYGTSRQRWIDRIPLPELKLRHAAGEFAPGSMEPKIRAIVGFLEGCGERAIVTDPDHVAAAVRGEAGTTVEA